MAFGTKPRVAIVTDSTSYPAAEMARALGITVHTVPLSLTLEGKTWRDGVDMTPSEFYAELKQSRGFPKTSQPSTGAFQALFEELAPEVEGIVCVLISRGITATVDSAALAAANVPGIPVEIVDSRGCGMMLGYAVLAAAHAAAAGADMNAVAEAARQAAVRTEAYFIVGTLEFLHRGGRIGLGAMLLGSALDIKPIVRFRDGTLEPVTKTRTMTKAVNALCEFMEDPIGRGKQAHVAIYHVDALRAAERFRDLVQERFHPRELFVTEVSPVLGAHGGPGSVGFVTYVE